MIVVGPLSVALRLSYVCAFSLVHTKHYHFLVAWKPYLGANITEKNVHAPGAVVLVMNAEQHVVPIKKY